MKTSLTALAFAITVLAGCASTPATRYHSLLNTGSPAAREAGLPPMSVDLTQVRLPSAVDQQQWVVRLPDDSLRILEGEQWVAPLRDEMRAALFERLAQRYAAVDARASNGPAAARVKVDVQRFESIAGREVWLDAVWSIQAEVGKTESGKPAALTCRTSVREAAPGDLPALAAAHRQAVIRLADQIGAQLLALTNGAASRCPA